MKPKQVIVFLFLIILVVALIAGSKSSLNKPNNKLSQGNDSQISNQEPPKIISTKPDPLDETLISSTEVIEITFNKPLENAPELKLRIEPKTEYKVELSFDRKTARIIPLKPYELGMNYTLFISPESKFDGGERLKQEKIFHFHTVRYRGV